MPYMLLVHYNGDDDLMRHELLMAGVKPATADHASVLSGVLGSMFVAQGSLEDMEAMRNKLAACKSEIVFQDDGSIAQWLRGEITLEEAEHESKRNKRW